MKNINKVRTAYSYALEFRDKKEARRFLFNIAEILIPYSDESIYTYRNNEEMVNWMKEGFKIYDYEESTLVIILTKPENFKEIKNMYNFKKENLRRGVSKYVFNGEL